MQLNFAHLTLILRSKFNWIFNFRGIGQLGVLVFVADVDVGEFGELPPDFSVAWLHCSGVLLSA